MESTLENATEPIRAAGEICAENTNIPMESVMQVNQKPKRKHRRGQRHKNAKKPFGKVNEKFKPPCYGNSNAGYCRSKGVGKGGGGGRAQTRRAGMNRNRRMKLERSRSLVPYNTNKFLMEEHMDDLPKPLMTPPRRTRESSFSVDSEDNYFFSLPEDEEDYLTKEFSNVYEKARIELLEAMSKQQLIEEYVDLEDRFQSKKHQHQIDIQRISAEYSAKIKVQDERIRELIKANQMLRAQLLRKTAADAANLCPLTSFAVSAEKPVPMDLGQPSCDESEDSESDSSSSSSSSYSSSSESEYSDGRKNDELENSTIENNRNNCVENNSSPESTAGNVSELNNKDINSKETS